MDNIWNICNAIVIIFELFGFSLLWIGAIGFIVHGRKPKLFNVIFDLFFSMDMDDGDD